MSDDRPPVYMDGDTMVIRASGMLGCTRAMAALVQGYTPMATPESVQNRFDDGDLHEASILQRLVDRYNLSPLPVPDGQEQHTCRLVVKTGLEIRGSMDGLDELGVLEGKSMAQAPFEKWMRTGFDTFPYYAYQISAYMLGMGKTRAFYGVKNKNSGVIDCRVIEGPPVAKSVLVARALEIEKAVKAALSREVDAADTECDRTMFPCPVYYLHQEKVEKQFDADPVLRELSQQWGDLQSKVTDMQKQQEEIKEKIAERLAVHGVEALDLGDGFGVSSKVESRKTVDWDRIRQDFPTLDPKRYTYDKPNSKPTTRITVPKVP